MEEKPKRKNETTAQAANAPADTKTKRIKALPPEAFAFDLIKKGQVVAAAHLKSSAVPHLSLNTPPSIPYSTKPLLDAQALMKKLTAVPINPTWDSFIDATQLTAKIFSKVSDFHVDFKRYEKGWHELLISHKDLLQYSDQIPSFEDIIAPPLDLYHLDLALPEKETAEEKRIILIDEIAGVRRIITDIYRNNDIIYKISPREFEEMMAELMRKEGFEVELTKQTRDGGRDIIAIAHTGRFPVTFLAECKRHGPNHPVSVEIIRSFSYVMGKYNASNGIIFTSSYFTADAREERDHPRGLQKRLEFMDNGDIMNWVQSYIKA